MGGVKRSFFFFSESSHVAYQIYRNEAENTMQANVLLLFINFLPLDGVKRSKHFFSAEGHVAYQIEKKEM